MVDTCDTEVERIRRWLEAGHSQRAMARELGLSQTAFRRRVQSFGLLEPRPAKTAVCQHCHETFEPGRSSRGLFCSNACQQMLAVELRHRRWLDGDSTAINRPSALRRAVIRRDGYACSGCESTMWRGLPIPLELEHKDGNSQNNDPENLCMLCPNCHAQTPTFKIKNKGRGRHERRRRYGAGQSH